MRWLFLILLLLNGALFGWFYQEQQGRARMAERSAIMAPKLTPLTLIEEARVGSLRPRPEQKPKTKLEPKSPAAAEPEVEHEVELPAQAEIDPFNPAAADKPLAAESYCYRIGHFASQSLAKVFGDTLEIAPGRFEVVEGQVPLAPDYWVYMPRPGSAVERTRLQGELKIDGLESYWVHQGELKGDLSLGLYRRKSSADALYAALVNKGYPAKLYRKARSELGYFIEIETQSSDFPQSSWSRELKRDHPELKSVKKTCLGLATAKIPK